MSERFYTLWSEGKLLFGEAVMALGMKYFEIIDVGMWFFDGTDGVEFDIKKSTLSQCEDGTPIHSVKNKLGGLDFSLEACSPFGLKSACFVKIRIENNTDEPSLEKLGFILRTAKECELIEDAPDCYASYNPRVGVWKKLSSTWQEESFGYSDGERKIVKKGDMNFCFDAKRGEGIAEIKLAPGGACEEFFAFDIGEASDFDYAERRSLTASDWKRELSRISAERLPSEVREGTESFKAITNLTVQLLQCFCRPKDTDFVFARQGGLQRQVWAFESMSVLESLMRIGDFSDYVEPVIDLYFNEFFTESGEMLVFGIPWAMATANVLQSFSVYAIQKNNAECFEKHFDKAYRSFLWIKNTRAAVVETDEIAGGLFPPLQSCDSPFVFQSWLNTDTFNLRGLKAFLVACELFGKDSPAKEVRAEYEDYLETVSAIWNKIRREENGCMKIPYSPKFSDEVIGKSFPFSPMVSYFVEALDFDAADAEKVIKAYTDLGMIRGGLYDRMPDKAGPYSTKYNLDENGRCVVWYVACQEYYWFLYFMRHGMRDRCEEILRDTFRYAMTDEYYMVERYKETDPYFVPWSPNASANGRAINMILDFYK